MTNIPSKMQERLDHPIDDLTPPGVINTLYCADIGYKLVDKCHESFYSALIHGREGHPLVYKKCQMSISIPEGARVIRGDSRTDGFRTDNITVLSLEAPDGTVCSHGVPHVWNREGLTYHAGQSYTSSLDTETGGHVSRQGIHFWTTPIRWK